MPEPTRAGESGSAEGPTTSTAWSRADFGVSGVVAVVVAVMAWVFRSEIVSTDPWHYVMAALQFPQDSWVALGYTRYGMILPLAPLVLAFGYAPATFYVPAIAASAVLAACVYLLGRRAWGPVAGITAVVLMLTNWIVFTNLSRFYPDIPSMALVMLALVVAVSARDRQLSGRRFGAALTVVVGFLLGWSFEARETALFAWPVVIIVLWVRGRVIRNAIMVAVPVLLWASLDILISAVAYGDPLLKLHTFTHQDLSATTNPADLLVMNQFVGLPRHDYVTMIPKLVLTSDLPGGVWFLMLGGLALAAVFVSNTAVRLSAGGFIVSYVLFVGIGGLFIPSHPAGRLDVQRYWIQFIPWIALAVAGALHVLVLAILRRSRWRQLVLVVASLALVAGPVTAVAREASTAPALATNGGAPLSGIAAEITRLQPAEGARLFTDWQTMRVLPIYRRPPFGGEKLWKIPMRSLTGKQEPVAGDYVLLVARNGSPCGFCTTALDPWRQENKRVPTSWERIYESAKNGYVLFTVG